MCNSLLGGERSERRERRGAVVVGEQGYFDHVLALFTDPWDPSQFSPILPKLPRDFA